MWSAKENDNCLQFVLLFQSLFVFLCCHFFSVRAQCENGLESTCVWAHDPKTALLWKMKKESQESYVELSKCVHPNCGIGIIQSPWLPPRDHAITATIQYKIYGTSRVYLRLNMNVDDTLTPTQLFSVNGNYAYGYPDAWNSESVTLPPTHTNYKLFLKAFIPYNEAMVAVKDINLDGTVMATSTSTSTTTSTTTTSTTTRTSTSTTKTTTKRTTTTTAKPDEEEEEKTSDDADYFPDVDEEDDEDERRFQALEVENFIGEEDLTQGYTTVVEPQICMYK